MTSIEASIGDLTCVNPIVEVFKFTGVDGHGL